MIEFIPPTRPVDRVFIHCTASDRDTTVGEVRRWHKTRTPPFNDIGYHFLIRRDGRIHGGRPLSKTPAAQKGNNKGTIAICLNGLTWFSIEQVGGLIELCLAIDAAWPPATRSTPFAPRITFHGHCEVANKSCPVLNYREILRLDDTGHIRRAK